MTVDIAALRKQHPTWKQLSFEECKREFVKYLSGPNSALWALGPYALTLLSHLEAAQARITELESKQEPARDLWTCDDCGVEWLDEHESQCHCTGTLGTWSLSKIYTRPSKPIVLPQPFAVRTGHPFNDGARTCMIPDDKGNWLSKLGVEHAIKIAGGIVEG